MSANKEEPDESGATYTGSFAPHTKVTSYLNERDRIHSEATEGEWTAQEDWGVITAGPDSVLHGYYDSECPSCGSEVIDDASVSIGAEDVDAIIDHHNSTPRMVTALRAVVTAHHPLRLTTYKNGCPEVRIICGGCTPRDGEWIVYPCDTVHAIATALGVTDD